MVKEEVVNTFSPLVASQTNAEKKKANGSFTGQIYSFLQLLSNVWI